MKLRKKADKNSMEYWFILLSTLLWSGFLSAGEQALLEKQLENFSPPPGCLQGTVSYQKEKCPKAFKILRAARSLGLSKPQKLEETLANSLKKIKSTKDYHYMSIFLGAITGGQSVSKELKRIAKMEDVANVKHPYAQFALERLEKGKCKKADKYPYQEICKYQDTYLNYAKKLEKF